MAELSRTLNKPSFASALLAKNTLRTDQIHQCLGEASLGLRVVEIGNVDEDSGLLDQRLRDLGFACPKAHGDAAAKIKARLPVTSEVASGPRLKAGQTARSGAQRASGRAPGAATSLRTMGGGQERFPS